MPINRAHVLPAIGFLAVVGSLSAQTVSIKLTSQALGLGTSALNDGSTVEPDVPGKMITSPTTGTGTVLYVQKSGKAGSGTPSDPLLCTITARSHLDTLIGLPAQHDYYAGSLYITAENNSTPDGVDEGAGVKAFSVGANGLRILSGGLAKIEGSKEISGGTGPTEFDSGGPNGAPHVDEEVIFTFNTLLPVLAAKTYALVSKFETTDKLDLRVEMTSGKMLTLLYQGTNNTPLFEAVSASGGLWKVNLSAVPGVTPQDLLKSFSVRAIDDNPTKPAGTAEHFLVTGATVFVTSDCTPSFSILGKPAIGNTVTIAMSGAPGCHVCAILSFNPGPIVIGNISIPAGIPFLHVISGDIPPGGAQTFPLSIPNNPALIGLKVYFGGLSLEGTNIMVAPPFNFTIVAP